MSSLTNSPGLSALRGIALLAGGPARFVPVATLVLGISLLAQHGVASESLQPSGRLQVDAARFASDQTPGSDDIIVRRARLGIGGTLHDVWGYKLQYELSDGEADPKSLWISYRQSQGLTFRAGHFKEPFGLQQGTSSKYNTFMERALPNVFSPGYHLGARVEAAGQRWLVHAGLFGGSLAPRHEVEHDGEALAARFIFSALENERSHFHLGASGEKRRYPDNYTLRLRERPETRALDVELVNTGKIKDVSTSLKYALESAFTHGPINLQAEYVAARYVRHAEMDLGFSGWYAQAGWFLTGEKREFRDGVYRGVEPLRRAGAVELALRYSSLDLSDGEIDGGEQNDISLALNWYPRVWLRVSLNHVWADVAAHDDMPAETPRVLQLRLQVHY